MALAGSSRDRLVRTLNSAYAGGLISEHTLAARLDQVLHRPLIDPEALIGDLRLREPRDRRVRGWISQAITTVADRLEISLEPRARDRLLALDWSGRHHELLVGRSTYCDIVLSDSTVSRRHARLISRDGSWILQDLDSKNGSYLNGHRVGRSELRPGDRLFLGEAALRVD